MRLCLYIKQNLLDKNKLKLPLKKRKAVYKIIFSYFLGIITYKEATQYLKEFGISRNKFAWFVATIPENVLNYILSNLRIRFYLNSCSVNKKDEEIIFSLKKVKKVKKRLSNLKVKKNKLLNLPKQEDVLKLMPKIKKEAGSIGYSDTPFLSAEDVLNELLIYALYTYRKYIFQVNFSINSKVLFYMILQKIRCQKLDILRKIKLSKEFEEKLKLELDK